MMKRWDKFASAFSDATVSKAEARARDWDVGRSLSAMAQPNLLAFDSIPLPPPPLPPQSPVGASESSPGLIDRCAFLTVNRRGLKPHANLCIASPSPHRFRVLHEIGKGTYGVVFRALDPQIPPPSPIPDALRTDEGVVAVKRMRLDAHDEGVPVTTLREVALLKDLRHENIVRLREVRAHAIKAHHE